MEQQQENIQQPIFLEKDTKLPKKNFYSNLTDSVGRNPTIALAVIVILIIVVLFLYAQNKGWFGLGKKKKTKSTKSDDAAESDDDDSSEIDDIIDNINNS